MLSYFLRILIAITLIINLVNCTREREYCPSLLQNKKQLCLDLKRQIIFNNNVAPTTYGETIWTSNTPTRQAMLIRQYQDNRCDEVLRECECVDTGE